MSARVNRRIGEAEELWLLLDGHQDLTHADDCDCLMRGVAVVLGVSGLLALACVGRAHGHPHAVGRDPGGLMEAVLAVNDERSEEHTSQLQSIMRIAVVVHCLKKKKKMHNDKTTIH